MRLSGLTRSLKRGISVVVIIWAAVNPAFASDSLRTVREQAHRVFHNLNISDTLNGHESFDSIDAQRCVRDAAVEMGALISPEKAKTIVTTSGTFGYLVDAHMDSLRAAFIKRTRFAAPIDVVRWYKMMEAYSQQGSVFDTSAIKYAAINGDSVYFYPVPARVDTIYLFYKARGAVPSVYTDTIDLPHEMYPAVEYMATVKAAAQISDATRLALYERLLDRALAKFIGGKTPQ